MRLSQIQRIEKKTSYPKGRTYFKGMDSEGWEFLSILQATTPSCVFVVVVFNETG
jgi:hypothetical protein